MTREGVSCLDFLLCQEVGHEHALYSVDVACVAWVVDYHEFGVAVLDGAQRGEFALAGIFGVWFRTDHEGAELGVAARVDASLAHHLIDAGGVGRYGVYHGGAEVGEELELAQGVARCSRDCKHAELLGSVLEAESSGEHSVTGSILEDIFRTASDHPEAACNGVGPLLEILLGVEDHGRVAGGAAGGVETHALGERDGCYAKGICVAQILLRGEGGALEVVEAAYVRRLDAYRVEPLVVEGGTFVAMLDCGLEPLKLEHFKLGALQGLKFGIEKLTHFN